MIKRGQVHTIARKQGADRYYKKFTTYKHLVTMLYLAFEGCTSIREVTTGLLACSTKLFHIGMDYSPKRSTLSDANKKKGQLFISLENHTTISFQKHTTLIQG